MVAFENAILRGDTSMDCAPEQKQIAKRTWAEVDRADPPKRAAEGRITDFHEIYALHDEATIREQASRCIQCYNPSCDDL